MSDTITIQELFTRHGIKFRQAGDEIQTFCLFGDCDAGKKELSDSHLYCSKEVFYCQKCNAKGNVFELAKQLGVPFREVYKNPLPEKITPELISTMEKEIQQEQSELQTSAGLLWLKNRGFTEETIEKFKLGYSKYYDGISIPQYQNGQPVSIKYRPFNPKPDKYKRKQGTPSVLFNMDSVDGKEEITIVEGEFDCIVGVQAGLKNIISITVGATTWKEEWTPLLKGFKKIYLCLDSDEKGREGTQKIAEILGLDRCFNVVLPEKDMNDFFLNGHTKEELDKLFAEAKQFPGAKRVVSSNDILKMTPKENPFIFQGMIVEGSVNALTSDSGKGKSLLMLKAVEAIVTGEKFLGEFATKKSKTLIIDLEMSENDVIQRVQSIVQHEVEGLDFYHAQTFNIFDDKDFDWLKNIIISNEYKLIVLDTYSMMAQSKNENDNAEANIVNRRMLELTNEYGVTILFLHHHRKLQKGEVMTQSTSRGATDIIGKTASHLLIDTRDIVVADGDIGLRGIKIVVEQMKRRQATGFERFAVKVWYNPEEKKSHFEFAGYDEKAENATEKTKGMIIGKMEPGEEYMMKDIKEMAGTSSNVYAALKELTDIDKTVGYRSPQEGEELENGHKIPKNAKIYFLTLNKEPIQPIQKLV
jgi:DNA primase